MEKKCLDENSEITIEELKKRLEKEIKKRRRRTVIFIIIILILLIFHFTLYKLGKIGYDRQASTYPTYETIEAIKLTQNGNEITSENRAKYF